MSEKITWLIMALILIAMALFGYYSISGGYAKFRTELAISTKSFNPKAGIYCTQIVGTSDMAISCVKEQ